MLTLNGMMPFSNIFSTFVGSKNYDLFGGHFYVME